MSENTGKIQELEARLKELEAAGHPDFAAIAAIHDQIDTIKAGGGDYEKAAPMELDGFDDWAAQGGERHDDPSDYGEGQSFNSAESEPAPSAQVETTPVQAAPGSNAGLEPAMEKVMLFLVQNVVVKSYNAITFKGKKKLPAIVKAAAGSGGPNPIGRLSFSIKRGFEQAFKKIKSSEKERNEIIFHMVLDLDENLYDVEHRDVGATRILKTVIAQDHLPQELYRKLDKKGAFDK